MVKLRNSFDGGTHGVVITPGNSGGVSGDAFTAVTPDALFSNARAHSGSLSMQLPVGAVAGYGRWAFPASKNVAARTWHWISETIVGTDFDIMQIRVGATNIATIRVSGYATPAGALRLRVGATTAWTAGVVFPANEWVRVEVLIEQGAGANDGRARLACYSGDSLTPIADSGWLTGLALAGDGPGVDSVVLGKTSAGASPAASMDDAAANTGADYTGQFIGPATVPATPSPVKAWRNGQYVDCDIYGWDGSEYIPVDVAHVLG